MTFDDRLMDAVDEAKHAFDACATIHEPHLKEFRDLGDLVETLIEDFDYKTRTVDYDVYIDAEGQPVLEIEGITLGTV